MKVTCRHCGQRVGWYRGVGINRYPVRLCEHTTAYGVKCPNSRKPLDHTVIKEIDK